MRCVNGQGCVPDTASITIGQIAYCLAARTCESSPLSRRPSDLSIFTGPEVATMTPQRHSVSMILRISLGAAAFWLSACGSSGGTGEGAGGSPAGSSGSQGGAGGATSLGG